jgi:hypothetical protein
MHEGEAQRHGEGTFRHRQCLQPMRRPRGRTPPKVGDRRVTRDVGTSGAGKGGAEEADDAGVQAGWTANEVPTGDGRYFIYRPGWGYSNRWI